MTAVPRRKYPRNRCLERIVYKDKAIVGGFEGGGSSEPGLGGGGGAPDYFGEGGGGGSVVVSVVEGFGVGIRG